MRTIEERVAAFDAAETIEEKVSMQASSPIGLAFGDCGISKWRNMTAADREELDGQVEWLNGGPRDGNARVTIYQRQEERP